MFWLISLVCLACVTALPTSVKELVAQNLHETVSLPALSSMPHHVTVKSQSKHGYREGFFPMTLPISFRAFGEDFTLHLEKNTELFGPTYTEADYHYDENHNLEKTVVHRAGMPVHENCHYTNAANSQIFAAVDTCYGSMRGMFIVKNEMYGIEPAKEVMSAAALSAHAKAFTTSSLSALHVVYKLSDIETPEFGCGVTAEEERAHSHGKTHDQMMRDAISSAKIQREKLAKLEEEKGVPVLQSGPKKYVELLLVNDNTRYVVCNREGKDVLTETAAIANMMNTAYKAASAYSSWTGVTTPISPSGKRQAFNYDISVVLVAQITWVNNDPYTMSKGTCNGCSTGQVDVKDLLPAFHSWRSNPTNLQSTPNALNHDNGHLLSGFDFVGSTLGYAGVGAMCQFSQSGGINMAIQKTSDAGTNPVGQANSFVAAVIVHEMGHNFGMQHDDPAKTPANCDSSNDDACSGVSSGGACPLSGFYMNSAVSSVSAPTQFSPCSVYYLNSFMSALSSAGGGTTCLDNVPVANWTASPVCGDGFISGNEVCDCGQTDCSSRDPCCNGATCQLIAGARCSSNNNACCNSATCQPVPTNTTAPCRASTGVCDLAETCADGSGYCPPDAFIGAGNPCTDPTYKAGVCYKGSCLNLDRACANAGKSVTGGPWTGCPQQEALNRGNYCGDLYCTSASVGSCVYFQVGTNLNAQVPAGTPCGSGSVCYQSKCTWAETTNNDYHWNNDDLLWKPCAECGTTQYRDMQCVRTSTSVRAASDLACTTQTSVVSSRNCRNATLGCVYAADLRSAWELFGTQVSSNTLMFSSLGAAALVLVVLACCYQAVTYGEKEPLDDNTPEHSQNGREGDGGEDDEDVEMDNRKRGATGGRGQAPASSHAPPASSNAPPSHAPPAYQ